MSVKCGSISFDQYCQSNNLDQEIPGEAVEMYQIILTSVLFL